MQAANESPTRPRPIDIVRNWILGCLLLIAVLAILTVAARVFAPIFLAVFIAAVLRMPVRALMHLGVPQAPAAIVMLLLFCGGVTATAFAIYEPATKWISEVPALTKKVEAKLQPLRRALANAAATAERIENATNIANPPARTVQIKPPSLIERLFHNSRVIAVQAAFVLVLSFFMTAIRQPLIPERLFDMTGEAGHRFRRSLVEIERKMGHYMGALALLNLAIGIVTGFVMWLCHMPNPLLWGVLAMLLHFIPYLGPVITASAIAAAAFLTFDTWPQILAPVIGYLTIHIAEGEFITPLVMGRVMTLHPVLIFIFVLVWGWMWGLAGAFLAVPILVTCIIVARDLMVTETETLGDIVFPRNWDAIMRGEDPYPMLDARAPPEAVTEKQ